MSLRTRLGIDIDADASGVDRGVGRAQGRLGKLGGFAAGAGRMIAGGLAAGAAGAVFVGKAAADAGSRLQQSMGAVESVFGRAATAVKRWSEDSAQAVGLSKAEYQELATVAGAQLKNLGFSTEESAKRSQALIKTGADLAATFGGSVSDAVSAVSSLMRGEADPIERYGVSIKAADINARMARDGLTGLTGEALKNAQAQTMLTLLNEQTASSAGAFARESDTLAGQQERLGATVENLKAKLGEHLLPALTGVTRWTVNRLLPGVEQLANGMGRSLGPAVRRAGAWFNGTLAPAIRELMPHFRRLASFIGETLVPAILGLVGWMASKIIPTFTEIARRVLPGVSAAFQTIGNKIRENRPQLQRILDAFNSLVDFIRKHVVPLLGKTLGTALEGLGTVIGTAIDIVGGLVDVFESVVSWAKKVIDWLGKIKVPKLDLPSIPGLTSAPGPGPRPPTLPPGNPGNPTSGTPVDARTYITVNVSPPAMTDSHTLAGDIVAAIAQYFTRQGLPAPWPSTGGGL